MKNHKLTLIFGLFLLLLFGCTSLKDRQIRKLDELALQQPGEFARLSNALNPCFSGKAKSDTVIVPGRNDTTTFVDTLREPGKPVVINTTQKIKVPVKYMIHDTIPDNRGLEAARAVAQAKSDSLILVKHDNTRLSNSNGSLIKWIIGLSLALLIIIGISVYKFIKGGFLTSLFKKQ